MPDRVEMQEMLDFTCAMWDDPLVYCYQNLELVPKEMSSVFLAGPSSRDDVLVFKWRSYAHHYLRQAGFRGIIVVPEPRNNDWSFKETFPTTIVDWEAKRLLSVDIGAFWIPRHPIQLPGRVTNTELGFLSGMAHACPDQFKDRLVWGYPPNAWKIKSEFHWVSIITGVKPFEDLQDMCEYISARLADV